MVARAGSLTTCRRTSRRMLLGQVRAVLPTRSVGYPSLCTKTRAHPNRSSPQRPTEDRAGNKTPLTTRVRHSAASPISRHSNAQFRPLASHWVVCATFTFRRFYSPTDRPQLHNLQALVPSPRQGYGPFYRQPKTARSDTGGCPAWKGGDLEVTNLVHNQWVVGREFLGF